MRGSSLIIAAIGLLALAGQVACQDRTETIRDSKGFKELVYRGEALAEERSYDARGAILSERFFDAGSLPSETRTYVRDGDRVARVEAKDASGSPSGSMEYRYDRNGRLLGVDSEGSLGEGSIGMIADRGAPQGSWITSPGPSEAADTTVLGYDDEGRTTIVQRMKGGAVVYSEKRDYGEGGGLASVSTLDMASGLSSELAYDEKGRISSREDTPAKGIKAVTEYRYDGSDRVVEELGSRGGHRSSKTYEYGEDGKLAREETRKDGELLLTVDYIEGGRVESLYEDGIVFVKATYRGGRKVKDEFFADGSSVRTRDY